MPLSRQIESDYKQPINKYVKAQKGFKMYDTQNGKGLEEEKCLNLFPKS